MICALALCASMMPTAVFAVGDQDAGTGTDISTSASQSDENSASDSGDTLPEDTNKTVNENSNGNGVDSTAAKGDGEETTGDTEGTGDSETTGSGQSQGTDEEDATLNEDTSKTSEKDTEETNPEGEEEKENASQKEEDESDQLNNTPVLDLTPNEISLYNADDDSRKIVDGQGEFYADPENKIWLSTRDGDFGNNQTVTFIIQMDGEEQDRVTVQNLPIFSVHLDVNAVLYDDEAWSDDLGIAVTRDDSGNNGGWLISNTNWGFVSEYTVTINFTERTLKDNDAIQIADGENVYGTFFWAKGSATSCDYTRTLKVYVNNVQAYQTTIQTPRSLGANTYWFESNLAQYTSDVRVEPGLLDDVTMKDVSVYLTTKCACGNPECTCTGGCRCAAGCGCPACKPNQQADTIYTPYGTITYDSDSVGVKMNLKVRLYVNGQQKYESQKFTTTNALNGSLGFSANESNGYYFLSQAASVNSYDIFVKKAGKTEWERNGSTWWPTDSRIVMASDDSNDEYVLCIYLYTFNHFMTLDVTRLNGTDAYVDGYTISYTARDPEDGTEKVFTYPATSFAAGQPQIVPYGREVTLTAVCKPGYAVDVWRADRDGSDLLLYGENGGNGPKISPQEAYGNTVYFNEYGTTNTQLQLQITSVKEVNTPTDDDLKNLLKNAITVECTTNTDHAAIQPGLLGTKDTDYTVTQSGNKVTVTITKTSLYVDEFDKSYPAGTHSYVEAGSDLSVAIVYDETTGDWSLDPENKAATIKVECDTISRPDDETVKDLLEQKVLVECTNGDNAHDDMSKPYGALEGGYTVGELKGDADKGYTVDVTILCDTYVTQYNTDTKSKHVLVSGEPAEKTITLQYDSDLEQWQGPAQQTVISVTCKVKKPGTPGDETVKDLLKNSIRVSCVNTDVAHGEKTYDLLDGSYKIGTVQGSETDGYTVEVTITNSDYLAQFNTDLKVKHELVSGAESTVTLCYVADSKTWKVDSNLPVEIQVTCKDVVDADIVITPEDLTIYRGGEVTEENGSNYNIVDENGDIMGNTGSLPEIGFSLQLSTDLNQKLHNALNVPTDQALDLAGRITLTAKTTDGNTTLEWELKHYGSEDGSSVTTTDKNGFYIYKIVPVGDTEGAKLNVSFINDKGDYVNTDAFEIEDNNNNLAATYKMMIYGDRVDASSLYATITYSDGKTETVSVQGAEKPATLTVRYTNTDASITHSFDTVAEASKSEDQNDKSKLTQSAYMIRKNAEEKPVDSFMVNNSDVQVDDQNVSLLFDDIAETTGTHYADTLKTKAVEAVKANNAGVDTSKLKTEAKYLDLVDATNGNVWVTTDDDVTIYWPFPEGTDASTTFYVAHFDGLDRDKDVETMTGEVNGATATLMDVETDQYGVYFTTKKFSPYVLVWDTTKPSGGNGGNGGGGTTTTTTNNNNTNNNTTTVNVTSNAAAQPQAATAAIPQTGDAMPVGLLGGLAAAAAAGFAALFVIRKRKQNG